MAIKTWLGTVTASLGDWSVAGNWSPSGVPVNGDDVFLDNSIQSVAAGFSQGAVLLASLTITNTFTGSIGDALTYLAIGASQVDIGKAIGSDRTAKGSQFIKLNLGTDAAQIRVHESKKTGTDPNLPPIQILAVNAATDLFVTGGVVGVAVGPAEVSTLGDATISAGPGKKTSPSMTIGLGATITNVDIAEGDSFLLSTPTTLTVTGGTVTTQADGAITTANVQGGKLISNSTGIITTLTIDRSGEVDFLKSSEVRTVTILNLGVGVLNLDKDVVTLTNDIVLVKTGATTISAS